MDTSYSPCAFHPHRVREVVSGVLVVRMVSYSIINGVGVGGGVPAAITIVVVLPSLLPSPLPLWWWWW